MAISALSATAARATLHCLVGCSIGEVMGMVVSTALGWSAAASIAISIVLAFAFGYALSIIPILSFGLGLLPAMKIAIISDTASIATMEIADNLFLLAVPGAIHATLDTALFWVSLAISLVVAFAVAFPVNRWLISRGKGHAVAHAYHGSGHAHEHHVSSSQMTQDEHCEDCEHHEDHEHHVHDHHSHKM